MIFEVGLLELNFKVGILIVELVPKTIEVVSWFL
jgi:hypothetical protein